MESRKMQGLNQTLPQEQEPSQQESLYRPLLESVVSGAPDEAVLLPIIQIIDTPPHSNPEGTRFLGSTVLLSKTIVGAGAAALPFAFAQLGLGFSIAFLLLMAVLTHFSIQAMSLGSILTGDQSYPGIVRALLGRAGSIALELSLVLRCAGLMVVYIVIAADILAGSKHLPGVLCDVFGDADWCQNRTWVAIGVTVLVLIPIVSTRSLASNTLTSYIGLSAVLLWAGASLYLGLHACFSHKVKGQCFPLPIWPHMTGSLGEIWIKVLATLPVLATAFTCQMTIGFIMSSMRDYSQNRMEQVSAAAVSLCTLLFLSVGISSIAAFGPKVPADVLEAFDQEALERLTSKEAALILGVLVRFGFLLSVLANFPMQMFPFRQSLARLTIGRDLQGVTYYVVTYVSLFAMCGVAILSGSIWKPLQLVGATAGAIIAFFFPAGIAFQVAKMGSQAGTLATNQTYLKIGGWALIVLGVVQGITGVAAALFLK